jgi:cytochrome c oxidase assembly protein subunit 11
MNAASPSPHRKLVKILLAVVVLSFAFGFALVPLYDVFCEITGLNGKTARAGAFAVGGIKASQANAAPSRIDASRIVTVEFTSTVMPGLPWEMHAITPSLDLHPGELQQAKFRVVNLSDQALTGQAIPSISPGNAARHFAKLDCFCFAQQGLAPHESKELTVTFIVQPELDRDVRTITLGYALFNVAAPAKLASGD